LSHYRKVFAETTDPTRREVVLKLIADEQGTDNDEVSGQPQRRMS
jgi:hypothetical protein